MKHARKAALAASAFVCAAMFSFSWSEQSGVSLSVDSAQAQSPGSAFLPSAGETPGVAYGQRRHHYRQAGYGYRPSHYRRAAYGYRPAGAAAVGAGLAAGAVGTAVAATQPWGWGGGPYYGGAYQPRAGYYASPALLPSEGSGGLNAYAMAPIKESDYKLYLKNLHDAGYNPKNNYDANGIVKTQ